MDGIVILVDSSFYNSIETIKVDRFRCVLCAGVLHAVATHILAVIAVVVSASVYLGDSPQKKIIQRIVRESSILMESLTDVSLHGLI